MNLRMTTRTAISALLRNRSRSLLTMLGVVIGVAAVIITVAIGVGARTSITAQINALGSNLLVVLPGSLNQGGVRSGNGAASTLTPADGIAIAGLPHVAAVSPTVNVRAQVVANGQNWQTTVTGVAPTYTYIRSWSLAAGTFFTDADVASAAKVAVLGQTVITNLFPNGVNPVGQTVLIRNVPFVVVGTLVSKGQSGVGQDQDDTILIPYTSALERLTGQTTLGSMSVSVDAPENVDGVQTETTALLEQRHHIPAGMPDDFSIRNLQDIASAAASTATILQLLLAGVAAVSLVVGGIGIMNIMLVSVTERTREIGIRLAVGARGADVRTQFLVESVAMSIIGGLAGLAVGYGGAALLGRLTGWSTATPPAAVLIAVGFSAAVGVFFGWYPARQAAALDPIQALRHE